MGISGMAAITTFVVLIEWHSESQMGRFRLVITCCTIAIGPRAATLRISSRGIRRKTWQTWSPRGVKLISAVLGTVTPNYQRLMSTAFDPQVSVLTIWPTCIGSRNGPSDTSKIDSVGHTYRRRSRCWNATVEIGSRRPPRSSWSSFGPSCRATSSSDRLTPLSGLPAGSSCGLFIARATESP
jgi:hypothetical protein